MQQGYYTNRITELEKRKEEVTAQVVTSKLTLKGIEKEIERCYEYMNSAHYNGEKDTSGMEERILYLENTIKKQKTRIKNLNTFNKKKTDEIEKLNQIIDDNNYEIETLTLKLNNQITKLNIKNQELKDLINKEEKVQEVITQNKSLKKENREFKRDIKALNERIDLMDKTIEKKNNEIRILHERLNWQPVTSDKQLEAK